VTLFFSKIIFGKDKNMIKEICQLGNAILRTPTGAVTDFSSPLVESLIQDLSDTLDATNGVGIAAPQIGVALKAILVVSRPSERCPNAPTIGPLTMINPLIAARSEWMEKGWEGCLSVPGIRGFVPRSSKVKVRWLDGLTRENREEEFSGFTARVLQHEIDHLDGTVFVDRLESMRDLVAESEYRKIIDAPK
jgi:peptide deformylase